jgi:hypothetical protein
MGAHCSPQADGDGGEQRRHHALVPLLAVGDGEVVGQQVGVFSGFMQVWLGLYKKKACSWIV